MTYTYSGNESLFWNERNKRSVNVGGGMDRVGVGVGLYHCDHYRDTGCPIQPQLHGSVSDLSDVQRWDGWRLWRRMPEWWEPWPV